MAGGAFLVWALFAGLLLYAVRLRPDQHREAPVKALVIGGGVALPTLVLAGLLAYGLRLLADLVRPAPAGGLQIEVTGEQWWWRVRYLPNDGGPVDTANEFFLPVGEPVTFRLRSSDVIHAFWVPSLGGKIDMIPGRVTDLVLHPTREGRYRGACAEYCGDSHALMNFEVVVVTREEFNQWLDRQRMPVNAPPAPAAAQGGVAFLANGCGACHTVRGTTADGVVGPDLTHVASRRMLGAGMLTNEPVTLRRWIEAVEDLKPGSHMPAFGMLPDGELEHLVAYLRDLR
jgi:cytochrome c oxidase subunit 2